MTFSFKTDGDEEAFCIAIVKAMWDYYDVPFTEGLGLINARWEGHDFKTWTEGVLYYGTPIFWADMIANPCPCDRGLGDQVCKARRDEAYKREKEGYKKGE